MIFELICDNRISAVLRRFPRLFRELFTRRPHPAGEREGNTAAATEFRPPPKNPGTMSDGDLFQIAHANRPVSYSVSSSNCSQPCLNSKLEVGFGILRHTCVNPIGAAEDGHFADGHNKFRTKAPARDASNDRQGA
jgi:hypothetical protein